MTLYFFNKDGRFTAHKEIVTCCFDTFFMSRPRQNSGNHCGYLDIVAHIQSEYKKNISTQKS